MIATLAEDLDEATDQQAGSALIATGPQDRGLIGGDWYPDGGSRRCGDGEPDPVGEVASLVAEGYGADEVPDVIAIALEGPVGRDVRDTARIVRAVGRQAVVAVAGTGDVAGRTATPARGRRRRLVATLGASPSLIDGVAAGGVFLDPAAAATSDVGAARAADAIAAQTDGNGAPRFADAAPGFSVALAGYC